MQSSISSFKSQYPPYSLSSSSSCLSFLPRRPVTSIPSSIFPSIISFRTQFLRSMWPIPSAFLSFNVCWTFLSSLTIRNFFFIFHTTCPTDLHFSPVPHVQDFKVFLIHFLNCPIFGTIQICAPKVKFLLLSRKEQPN